MKRKKIILAADVIIKRKDGGIVLVRRRFYPYVGYWALPGGMVEYGEAVEAAAIREAKEETSLRVRLEKLVGVYSKPGRDPRGHCVSICFLARETGGKLEAKSDAAEVGVFKTSKKLPRKIAFDHRKMLKDSGLF